MANALLQRSSLCLVLILPTCTPLITPLEQSSAPQTPTPPRQGAFKFAYTQPQPPQTAEPYVYSMRELAIATKGMAGLRAELASDGAGLQLRDARLAEVAVLILSSPPQEKEWAAFANYLRDGGFFIGTRSQAEEVRKALDVYEGPAAAEERVYTMPLNDDHPLFAGLQDMSATPAERKTYRLPSLSGFFFQDRVVGVLADDPGVPGLVGSTSNFEPLVDKTKLTVSIMVYALQQEGSITWKQQHREGTSQATPASTPQ
ncbi:MAG: hypothetical protein IT369_09545 [Candidatus Latescibacteria bacterium]|nr:hypothetical protein [Candidatus Latescibacterota bacterium]